MVGKVEPQEIPDSIAALSKQGNFREEDMDTVTLDTVKQKIAELKKIDPSLPRYGRNKSEYSGSLSERFESSHRTH